MNTKSLVIKPHQPRRTALIRLGLALALLAVVAGVWQYGRWQGGYDSVAAQKTEQALRDQLAQARKDNQDLREKVALLQRSNQIDQEARDQVRGNVGDLQDQILKLREELAFYRGIVSPEDGESGLKIQNFRITAGPDNRVYHYRLMLIQAVKHDRRADGVVNVTLHGVQGGQPVSLKLNDVALDKKGRPVFSFRYFQDLEGD
ncbi:MAG: hypothetical protein PVG21_05875, partial [Gammaproteobacteria bacterium]